MKGELNPFVAARATGVPSIEEGRIFLLVPSRYREGDLKPELFESVMYDTDGTAYKVYRAGLDMPVACWCGSIFRKTLTPVRSSMWMYMTSSCAEHPYSIWVDYFPKARGPSPVGDFINMFPHYIDSGKRFHVDFLEIPNYPPVCVFTEGILYRRWVDSAPVEYALTMKGLVSLRTSLVDKARKLFLPRKT